MWGRLFLLFVACAECHHIAENLHRLLSSRQTVQQEASAEEKRIANLRNASSLNVGYSTVMMGKDAYCRKVSSSSSIKTCTRVTYLHRCKVSILVCWRHAHGRVDRRRRCWAVWSACGARVVLAATPAETNTRVADWIALRRGVGRIGRSHSPFLEES